MNIIQQILKPILQVLSIRIFLEKIVSFAKIPTTFLLIAVNLIPILGVIFFNWNPFDLIILFWFENIVIGIYNFFKLTLTESSGKSKKIEEILVKNRQLSSSVKAFDKIFLSGFFALHYGTFTLVHGIFVMVLFAGESTIFTSSNWLGFIGFAIGLFISHGISFLYNFLVKKEYLRRSSDYYFLLPYKRIIPIHIFIIFGGMLAANIENPAWLTVGFVIIKIVIDLYGHISEHTSMS
jgi:hypothetical protein